MMKYKSLFLSEASEHLNQMENMLVKVEKHDPDPDAVHEMFRHLHSLKGMAASMGYDGMSRLAHRLEDLLAVHRQQGSVVSQEEVEILFKGLDVLRSQLKAAAEDKKVEEAPADLTSAILQVKRPKPVEKRTSPAPSSETPAETPGPVAQLADSWFVVRARVCEDCTLPAARAFLLAKRLSELGSVVESQPSLDALRGGSMNGRMVVMKLLSPRGIDEVRRIAEAVPEFDIIEVQNSSPPVSAVAHPVGTVRVNSELLDFFVDAVGELITQRASFEELAERLDVPVLQESVRRLSGAVRRLHDRVMEIRLVSASTLTQRFPRVCRDIAKKRGKQVRFLVEGEDVQLDRALVEALDIPLLHLIRNAVDHGTEAADERRKRGKPEESVVALNIFRQQDRVIMTLSDDGRGIDPKRVETRARELKLISDAGPLKASDAADLIFLPGFSTQEGVSELSGRGVGLDVVRNTIAQLGGRVSVSSQLGRGTTFTLDLPLTLAILQVLMVKTGGHLLALPASRVLRAASISPNQRTEDASGTSISFGRDTLPYADLLALLQQEKERTPPYRSEVVIVGENDRPALALGVDHVAGHRETVLKKLGATLLALGLFSASTILGDGRPVMILDTDALIQRATQVRGKST
jgi:two-component system, chemotaxis family, sensor kinase CheA